MQYTGALGAAFKQAKSRTFFQANDNTIDTTNAVIGLIVAGSLIRIALAGAVGFGTDESYTVANARYFAWSYVDYPPLHVWLVGAWSWICGSEAPIVLRLPFIALFAGSTWVMFRLTALLFDDAAGFWAALLFNLAPVFTLAHASWVLPDGPLAFLMLSGAFAAARLLFATDEPSRAMAGWAGTGLLAGLAMLTKFHGVFLPSAIFAFLLTWRPGRQVLASPAPWLGAAIAVAVFLPVILWNLHHGGIGLFFQTKRLTAAPHPSLVRVLGAILSQSAYLTPWLFVPLATAWIAALARGPSVPRTWFLALLASGPIIVFTAANFVARGLPHWPMPGWLFAFPLLGAEAVRLARFRPRFVGYGCAASAGLLLVLVAIFATDGRTGWLANRFPRQYAHLDPTLDLLNWTELDRAIPERRLIDTATPAAAAIRWMDAGKLNYAIGRSIPVLCLCSDPQQFRYLHNPAQFSGRNIIVIGTRKDLADPHTTLLHWFTRVETLAPVTLHRAGQPAIELAIVRGVGFKPYGAAFSVVEPHPHAGETIIARR
ncbi:MAG: ArnT family glycosyltransferase [Rhizomicrobium sp.]